MSKRKIPFSDNEVDKAVELHEKSIVFIMHDHYPLREEIPRMIAGGVTGIVLKLTVDVEISGDIEASAKRFEGFTRMGLKAMDSAYSYIEENGNAILALKASDMEKAKKENKAAVVFGNEGGKLLEGEIASLRMFYRLGLRDMQLTWAVPNQLCRGWEADGLTGFGVDVVREMNRLGIIIDASHLPQSAFTDLLETSKDPFIVSHGVAGREQPLDQHIAMAEMGGLLGVHFYYSYLHKKGKEHIDLEDLLDKIDFSVENLGIDHVGLGADFFPSVGAWADLQHAQGTCNIEWAVSDVSRMLEVTKGLVARGFSDNEVRKILGENYLRIYRRVVGA